MYDDKNIARVDLHIIPHTLVHNMLLLVNMSMSYPLPKIKMCFSTRRNAKFLVSETNYKRAIVEELHHFLEYN